MIARHVTDISIEFGVYRGRGVSRLEAKCGIRNARLWADLAPLITRDTVEQKVLELQKTKRDLAAAIIGAENSLIRNLHQADLELLLRSGLEIYQRNCDVAAVTNISRCRGTRTRRSRDSSESFVRVSAFHAL